MSVQPKELLACPVGARHEQEKTSGQGHFLRPLLGSRIPDLCHLDRHGNHHVCTPKYITTHSRDGQT
jgi:hypothetical protein